MRDRDDRLIWEAKKYSYEEWANKYPAGHEGVALHDVYVVYGLIGDKIEKNDYVRGGDLGFPRLFSETEVETEEFKTLYGGDQHTVEDIYQVSGTKPQYSIEKLANKCDIFRVLDSIKGSFRGRARGPISLQNIEDHVTFDQIEVSKCKTKSI